MNRRTPLNAFQVLPRYTRLRHYARPRPIRSKLRPGVVKDKGYREWILAQPCIVHGEACPGWIEGHHDGHPRNDRRMVPLCRELHREGKEAVHQIQRRAFEERFRISFDAAVQGLNDEYEVRDWRAA